MLLLWNCVRSNALWFLASPLHPFPGYYPNFLFRQKHWIQSSCFCASEHTRSVYTCKIHHKRLLSCVLCRYQADCEVMWQHIARCFMFKHESGEVCEDRGVETSQTPKNACVRDFDLPIGASEFMNMMHAASFSLSVLQPCIIIKNCQLGAAHSFERSI